MKANFRILDEEEYKNIYVYEPDDKIQHVFAYLKSRFEEDKLVNIMSFYNLTEYSVIEVGYRGEERDFIRKMSNAMKPYKHKIKGAGLPF